MRFIKHIKIIYSLSTHATHNFKRVGDLAPHIFN